MIQTYNDMSRQIRQFESDWSGDGQIQKIYSSARFICLSVRSAGRTRYLYFGRGKGHEGLWEGDSQVPSPLRKKDQMLEYMRRHLSGRAFMGLELDPVDRVLWFHYQSFHKKCSFGLFYNGRNLYFANIGPEGKAHEMTLFKSWQKGHHPPMAKEAVFSEVGKKAQDTSVLSKEIKNIEGLLEAELKDGLSLAGPQKKEKKFLNRKRKNIQSDLDRARRWNGLNDWLIEQDDLGELSKKIEVCGVKINFKDKGHFKRRDEVYEKIKKLKRGEKILEKRLLDIKRPSSEETGEIEKSRLEVIRPVWPNKGLPQVEGPEVQSGDKGFKVYKYEDYELGIGESAQGNDQLRKSWGKKDDLWLHLDQATSPHIILRPSTRVLDESVLKEVAKLMRKYTQSDASEFNLIYTQVKNLKGISGRPGAVIFKKEKRVRIILD